MGLPLLGLSLCLVLLSAGALGFEAYRSARSQRATSALAVHEFASFAVWSVSRYAEGGYAEVLLIFFQSLGEKPATRESIPPAQWLVNRADDLRRCNCYAQIPPLAYFRVSYADSVTSMVAPDGTPLGATDENLRFSKRVRNAIARGERENPGKRLNVVVASEAPQNELFAYVAVRDSAAKLIAAYGFVTTQEQYAASMFPSIMHDKTLVPGTRGASAASESLFVLTVRDRSGRRIFRTDSNFNDATAVARDTLSLSPMHGGFMLELAVRPEASSQLQLLSVPTSRVPLWLSILALTAGLVAVGAWRLREEHRTARVRAEFVTSVSHELRTPLAQILLFGETLTLKRTRTESQRQAAAEVIVREARRLMRLVENALHFARTERVTNVSAPERMELASEVAEILESFTPIAEAASNALRDDLEDGLIVSIDRSAFRQILLNLLDNAVRYGPRGQTVQVELVRSNSHARLMIRDEGAGVSPAESHTIWQPFVRGSSGLASGESGSGIGLSVVRDLVARSGGRVWASSSAASRGAEFTLELPLAASSDPESNGTNSRR